MFPHGLCIPERFPSPTCPDFSTALCCSSLRPLSSDAALRKWMQQPTSPSVSLGASPLQFHLFIYGIKDIATERFIVLKWEIMSVWLCVLLSLSLQTIKVQMERIFFSEKYYVSSTTQNTSKTVKFHICELPYKLIQSNILYKAEILLLESF